MSFWRNLFGLPEPAPRVPLTGGGLSFGAQLGAEVQSKAPVKPAEQRQTNADRLDALCEEFAATYEIRKRDGDGQKIVVLKMADGDVVTGRGNNMAEALDEVERKARG
jgi:hypothetical protein